MEKKILTREIVEKLGLNKVSAITADMLECYTSIDNLAFYGCTNLISITISNSVTNIGRFAFAECTGLNSVVIPNSVTNIGRFTFSGCTNLTSITIPNSVTSIEWGTFGWCSGLTSIEIPNSITSIGDHAFSGCSGLISITIPNSVTSIGDHAFYGCTSLTSVTIGNKTYKKQTSHNGRCKAYKGFSGDMKCRDFQYEEGKTYGFDGKPILCECGFHACLSLSDVFNYYSGKIDKDIVVHKIELEGVTDERRKFDSKIAGNKITIGKRIL